MRTCRLAKLIMRKISNQTEFALLHREQIALRKNSELHGGSHIVEFSAAYMDRLEADTIRLEGNPRLKSSPGNLKNLAEMRQRGIVLLDNPKGEMLIGRKESHTPAGRTFLTYTLADGLHTYRSEKELARMEGREMGNYVVRVHFMTPAEQRYWDTFGDAHFKPRSTAEVATLIDSKGNVVPKGHLKTKMCQISDKLHSFSIGQYGGDKKTAADRTMQFHTDYRAEIEFVTGFSAVMKLKTTRENNSAVLAVFCDAIRRLGQPVKTFYRQYAALTYTDENHEHECATRLLTWLRDQKLAARSGTQNVVMGTSYWIAAYVLGWPAYRKDNRNISTDTSRYFIIEAQRELAMEDILKTNTDQDNINKEKANRAKATGVAARLKALPNVRT